MNTSPNTITITKEYKLAELNACIQKTANLIVEESKSGKNLAMQFLELHDLSKKCVETKDLKFPEWFDSIFGAKYSGQTAYKYMQICREYGESVYWDFFTIGKLRDSLNCRGILKVKDENGKEKNASAIESFADFLTWYGDAVNTVRLSNHAKWTDENEKYLAKIDKATSEGDEETADLWRAKLTPEPENGITVPPDGAELNEYYDKCHDFGLYALSDMTDKQFSDLVKAYRKPSEWGLVKKNGAYIAEKLEVVETSEKPSDGKSDNKPKTPDELKANAHSALLAYVSTFAEGKVPKTLMQALALLKKGE